MKIKRNEKKKRNSPIWRLDDLGRIDLEFGMKGMGKGTATIGPLLARGNFTTWWVGYHLLIGDGRKVVLKNI